MPDAESPNRWAVRPARPERRSIVELIRSGTLDPELAATLWVLIEGGVPILVAGVGAGAGRTTLLDALLDFVETDRRIIELTGVGETFDWLPHASELGWTGPHGRRSSDEPPLRPETTLLLIPELSDELPSYTWGPEARLAVRAASIGYGLAATIGGDSLEDVQTSLRRAPVGLDEDELSRLGVVLILRRLPDGRRRVAAAHYVRPTARDVHGHIQRLGPAVLATWDATSDGFEHFGWGIVPELALRTGAHAGDFEIEVDRRRDLLAGLDRAGIIDVDAVRRAIDADRHGTARPPAQPSAAPN